MIIDTHCHFDMYPNPLDIVNQSEKKGIITIGMTNLPSHFKMGYPHIQGFKKVRLALGMHPLMAEMHNEEFSLFYKYLNYTSYIGEIGLDFSRAGINTKERQINSFIKILKAVENKPKVLSIHSRKAEKEVLKQLQNFDIKNAIFHWYSGGLKLIDEIVKSGYYFSINPAMIKTDSGRKIIDRIPKEFILTESDGPYIEHENSVIQPKDIELVIDYLSKLYRQDYQLIERLIRSNFQRIMNSIRL